mgnify:CR=1 FL=1
MQVFHVVAFTKQNTEPTFNVMTKKHFRAAIALTLMATTLAGCGSSSNNADTPEPVVCPVTTPTSLELTRSELEMVKASNDFAFDLFSAAQDEEKSQILSPISIIYALGMLNNGATGDTQQQINRALGFGDAGADSINNFCYKMLNMAPTLEPQAKVSIANTIYVNQPIALYPDFVAKAKAFYNAEPEIRDFNDGKTLDVINQWASDNTEGMIKKVLDEDSFDPTFVSYLLNAIYFKGMWAKKFDKKSTISEKFEHAGFTKELRIVDMMTQMDRFAYAENDDYQALRLPYGNGSFEMTVLLPKSKEAIVKYMLPKVPTVDTWKKLNLHMRSTRVDVLLPRFETDTDLALKPIMQKLGMTDAFNSQQASFPNLCNLKTHIDMIKQVAKIKLDEEGTEAAAVTVIGVNTTAMPDLQPIITFHADHPFIYVISEQQTGAIFFIGQYTGN